MGKRCIFPSMINNLVLLVFFFVVTGCAGPATQVQAPRAPARCCARPAGIEIPQLRSRLIGAGISPDRILCNAFAGWEPSLDERAGEIVDGIARIWNVTPDKVARDRAHHHALGYLVRGYHDQVHPHNLGATVLKNHYYKDSSGENRPLVVFRSALTTTPDGQSRCFESLVRHGGVRHVINLYGGTFPFQDMIEAEREQARSLGVTFFDAAADPSLAWRKLVQHEKEYADNLPEAMRRLARLIREHLLRPQGKPPRGNLYVHCCGGMHRSGMLHGVLGRCINGASMDQLEAEYRWHTAWQSNARPGGYEPLNTRFIKDFDCSLLQ